MNKKRISIIIIIITISTIGGIYYYNKDTNLQNSFSKPQIQTEIQEDNLIISHNGGDPISIKKINMIIDNTSLSLSENGILHSGQVITTKIPENQKENKITITYDNSFELTTTEITTQEYSIKKSSTEPYYNGSEYEISTLEELNWIRNDLDNDYILTNNIDASDTQNWSQTYEDYNIETKGLQPIGIIQDNNIYNPNNPIFEGKEFSGTFNGNEYTINNIYIERFDRHQGLFSKISGTVKNLKIENMNLKRGSGISGGLTGTLSDGIINNCYVDINDNNINDVKRERVGGIVGFSDNGKVLNSTINGVLEEGGSIGGVIGYAKNSYIENTYSSIQNTTNAD
ncbi:MAG: hypothetical protein ACOCP8_04535, partial [archaeon]